MKERIQQIVELSKTPLGIFELAVVAIIALCVFAMFTSILINFVEAHGISRVKARKRSIVDTASMTAFFIGFYALIRFRIGVLPVASVPLRIVLAVAGVAVIVLGTCVNIAGRLSLGKNWADQVTIYSDQELVTTGVYGLVRHPLYASLVWMFYGASCAYLNVAAFLANTCIFVPFMVYRARQEEALLRKEFGNYEAYRTEVGMLFPKGRRR